jgi:hypothetical protein
MVRELRERVSSMTEEALARHIDGYWRRCKNDQPKYDFVARIEAIDKVKTDRALRIIDQTSSNPESGFLAAAMWDQEHPMVC